MRRWLGVRISASGAMCRSLIAVGASGKARRPPRKRCMPTGDGFEGIVGNDCCGSEASCWNVPTRISTKPGGCGGCICAGMQHLEAPARARLWRQSRVAHAAADERWYAAEPPGPRGRPAWCLDQPPGRALQPFEAILGPGGPRCAGFVVGETATGQYEHTILDLRRAPSATGC